MSLEKEFEFIFEDNNKLKMSKEDFIEISPNLYSRTIKNSTSKKISIPKFIKYYDFKDFSEIYKSYISRLREFNQEESFISINLIIKNYNINIAQLIQISEFFENSSFSKILIKDCIISKNKDKGNFDNRYHTLNLDNSILLLYLSYNKLREINNNKSKTKDINNEEDLENIWLELFMKTLDIIGKNLNYFFNSRYIFNDYTHNQLWSLDKKIIDELYEKYSYNLIAKNYIVSTHENKIPNMNSMTNKENIIELNVLEEIVNFLIQKRNQKDLFYLLSNEYFQITSEENLNELNSLPNPTFILKININDIDNYYEEYTLNNLFCSNDQFKLILIVFYKKNEDSFNVSIKLSKNNNLKWNIDIMTFLSLATIEEINNKQINVKSLSNNKSMYEIFKLTSFKKSRNNNSELNDYFTFKLFLKPCYIYILLSNYLFFNLENLSNNENISKLNKNLLSILISKKYLNKLEENSNYNCDFIVECLINWLNDEINIVEDISDIIKNIKWEKVSLPKLFEFLIKYSSNFESDDIDYIFSKSLLKILKQFDGNIELLSQEILKSLVISSNKINFISLFSENKKMKKFNLFELISQRRYIYSELNSKDNKYKTTNNSYLNTIDKKEDESYPKTQTISKNNSFYKKKNKLIKKREIKTCKGRSPIKLREEKSMKNKHSKNISFNSNNSNNICYNNYFSNYNNNFNINIRLDNKFKKIKNPKTLNNRNYSDFKIKANKNKKEKISRNNKNKISDLSSISKTKQREQNSSYINTCNLKKKLENIYHKTNLNKTINIKNLKLLQNKIMNKQKDLSRNKIINNIKSKTNIEIKNKKNLIINDNRPYNNYDKDNQEKSIYNSNIGNITDKNKMNLNRKNFKLKEILKIAGKDKKKNNFFSNLKSLKKDIKK